MLVAVGGKSTSYLLQTGQHNWESGNETYHQCVKTLETLGRGQDAIFCRYRCRKLQGQVQSSGCAEPEQEGESASTALRRARFLRVKITDAASGSVRLETRLPSQFVDSISQIIPQVSADPLHEW